VTGKRNAIENNMTALRLEPPGCPIAASGLKLKIS